MKGDIMCRYVYVCSYVRTCSEIILATTCTFTQNCNHLSLYVAICIATISYATKYLRAETFTVEYVETKGHGQTFTVAASINN